MRWGLVFILSLLCLMQVGAALRHSVEASYDIYVAVGKGPEGEDGPVKDASVELTSPGGAIQTKKSDSEGSTKFTVDKTGRYLVKVKADGFDQYDGRVIVDGKDSQVYHLAFLVPAKDENGKARIKVRAIDQDSGLPIEGAKVETTASHLPATDRMETDRSGEAMVRLAFASSDRYSNYKVTVSAPGYTRQIQNVKADSRDTKVNNLEFSMRREAGTRMILVAAREMGTRAPVMNAHVTLDGGGNNIQVVDTSPEGIALFRVTKNVVYKVKITTSLYDDVSDTIDLAADKKSPNISRTYDLEKKESAREIRRALFVFVKGKDSKGVVKPLEGATVDGPGLHGAVTDSSGRMVFLHKTPPGEVIRVTAQHQNYVTGGGEVLVRDKGVMIDVRRFEKDSLSMSDFDAARKQGVTGYDTVNITLEWDKFLEVPQVVGQIEAPEESNPGEEFGYSTQLTLKEGLEDSITIEETIQVLDSSGSIVARTGSIRALNAGEPSRKSYAFTPTKPGTYRIKSKVMHEKDVLWTGERSIRIAEDRRKPTITGTVVPKKGRVKIDEMISVGVNVLYESGPSETLHVSEIVELFEPKGNVGQNNLSSRNLKLSAYSERNFNIVCQSPGVYRLKSTIKDDSGNVLWTSEASFTVENVGKPVMEKGTGYYRLKSKKPGKASDGTNDQYGVGSSSTSESNFTYTYEGKAPNDSHVKFNVQWSVPPTIVKPNDSFELTVAGTGSSTGKNRAYVGVGAGWDVGGSASIAAKQSVYVGVDSNGKDYPSANAKWKIVVGAGGSFRLWNYAVGAPGISADAGTPCIYEYEWIAGAKPPSSNNGKSTLTAGAETTSSSGSNAYRSGSVSLGSMGSVSLQVSLGKDFTGSGKSADGRLIISMYGAYNSTKGSLSGSGTLSRNGTRYSFTVTGQKTGSEIVGTITMKSGKGTVKHPFRLNRG